ncbi:MAG: hypothetical protein K2M01_04030 [Paramuribaculum sp.]|nr:hypothetical protein [Paramuribaculum sp.]
MSPDEAAPDNDELNPSQPKGYSREPYSEPRGKLNCYNWLGNIPSSATDSDLVEVEFKNTRKGFYRNTNNLDLEIGTMVAVEAQPGHDIGRVTLLGPLVKMRLRRSGIKPNTEFKRVFRIARQGDLDKFKESRAKENDTMIRARKIAESLGLNMKIGDVEYQGDGNKAIFYYISDERVDFRQLIKVLAETFKVRIEMKQIGARQEAGRIGGIGPCGRPLCCSSWMTNFVSVGTAAARFQDISLNPQKLAGQCAKLKCCLNFEVDAYVESLKQLPPKEIRLETADATYYHFKYDVFNHTITYSTDKNIPANLVTLDAERAFEVIAMNKQGEKPATLLRESDAAAAEAQQKQQYNDILGNDITRFDKKKKKKKPKPKNNAPDNAKEPKQDRPEKEKEDNKQRKPDKERNKQRDKQPKQNNNRPQQQQQQQQQQPQQPQQDKEKKEPKEQQSPRRKPKQFRFDQDQ